MSTRLTRLLLGSTLLAVAPTLSAKPPDLPLRPVDSCETAAAPVPAGDDARREEGARHLYQIGEKCQARGDLAMARNCYHEAQLLCPGSAPARLAAERLRAMADDGDGEAQDLIGPRERASDAIRPPRGHTVSESKADLRRLAEARVLHALGERCRIHGDHDMAYDFYRDSYNACPASRFAQMSAKRMREIDELRAARGRQFGDDETQEPPAPLPPCLDESALRPVPQGEALVLGWMERVAAALWAPERPRIVIETETPLAGSAEEQESAMFPQTAPPPLFVAGPVRDLVLRPEPTAEPAVVQAAGEDLSDWLRDTVRVLRGSGSLRIDASRLARLVGEGERALRELGCGLEHTADGRSFVVYPAPRSSR